MGNENWGGKRKKAGRPQLLPTDTLGEKRKNRTFYATSREQQFIKDMLQLFRGQRDFKPFEKEKTFAEVIDFIRNIQLDYTITNQDKEEEEKPKLEKRITNQGQESADSWAQAVTQAVATNA